MTNCNIESQASHVRVNQKRSSRIKARKAKYGLEYLVNDQILSRDLCSMP